MPVSNGSAQAVGEGGEIVVSVRDLSKCYQIYATPQDRLKQSIMPRLQRLFGASPRRYFDEFWALRDVSFDIRRGDTLGIIGRNGSGKSTLLQMLCGTLTPTAGEIQIKGRVAALLELGAGFNPEFTGRENVYLNATVLGLTSEEVDARFASIASFADIGDFIERPVKTYSSGMYVRLAFAVVAHVDADILVIDEALAVGDAVFGQKCMRFLRRFKEHGTLVFVSHDTSAVLNLCQTAVWLDKGCARMQGAAQDVANAYMRYTAEQVYGDAVKLYDLDGVSEPEPLELPPIPVDENTRLTMFDNIRNSDGWTTGKATVVAADFRTQAGQILGVFAGGERVRLQVRVTVQETLSSPIVGFLVKDRLGQELFGENTFTTHPGHVATAGQSIEAVFAFVLPMLPNGVYSVTVAIADGDLANHIQHHWLHDALMIHVSSAKPRYGLVGIPFDRVEMKVLSE